MRRAPHDVYALLHRPSEILQTVGSSQAHNYPFVCYSPRGKNPRLLFELNETIRSNARTSIGPSRSVACGCEAVIREVDRDAAISRVVERSDALAIAAQHPDTDLILWHVHDQPEEDFEILQSLSQYAMGIPIIVLANKSNPEQIMRALNLGVKGYIDLPAKKDQIVAIFRLILAGGCYCPTSVLADDELDAAVAIKDPVSVTAERRPLRCVRGKCFSFSWPATRIRKLPPSWALRRPRSSCTSRRF